MVQSVASPPYDVLNSQEARLLVANNPHSYLRVVKAEVNFPPDIDPHREEVYHKGAEILRDFISKGILIKDLSPCFYLYRLNSGSHSQLGLVFGASIDEYENGLIKKHEFTRQDKEDDRAQHIDILNANTGPVMLSYRTDPSFDHHLGEISDNSAPAYDFVAADGVQHTVWVVSDQASVQLIQERFKKIGPLYIADGHHRSAAAARVRARRKERNPAYSGNELCDYFLAVAFPDTQQRILGYHRAVKDLAGLSSEEFLAKVSSNFNISPTRDPNPEKPRQFTMLLDETWYRLEARKGSFPESDPVESLDASILQKNLLEPVLKLTNLRTNDRIDFIGGIRGTEELVKRCREDMRVAFALYPTSIREMMAVADSGEIMPPKSTWFEPKLRSGIITRVL